MTSVSNSQISKSFRANRPKSVQWLGRFVLSSLGWKVTGKIKEEHKNQKIVIVVAPHTSNWDGILGMAALAGLDARISFFGKHTIFRYFGLGAFLKYMGGIPDHPSEIDVVTKRDRSRPMQHRHASKVHTCEQSLQLHEAGQNFPLLSSHLLQVLQRGYGLRIVHTQFLLPMHLDAFGRAHCIEP